MQVLTFQTNFKPTRFKDPRESTACILASSSVNLRPLSIAPIQEFEKTSNSSFKIKIQSIKVFDQDPTYKNTRIPKILKRNPNPEKHQSKTNRQKPATFKFNIQAMILN